MIPNDAVLCYVRLPWVYFTTCELSQQWGDDWDDAPYEHNAGPPYVWESSKDGRPYKIFVVAIDKDYREPHSGYVNSPYSVRAINAGAIAWLRTYVITNLCAPAGMRWDEFKNFIRATNGKIYTQIEEGEL